MTFEIEVAGRVRRVGVHRGAHGEQVLVDGVPVAVDLAAAGGSWSLLVGHRSYDVTITDEPGGVTMVRVNGQAMPAIVRSTGRFGAAARRGTVEHRDGPHRLIAPMPGRIVKVLAQPGQAVVARQALVVVEAMKMENELRSPKSGTVTDVRVTEGTLVEAGTLLVVVE